MTSFHHNNAALADGILLTILFDIVTNHGIFRHLDAFIQNGPADSGASANFTAIENDGLLHHGTVVNVYTPA